MALQLLPLLFGGYAAKLGIDRGLAKSDRQELSTGLEAIFGGAPPPGQTSDSAPGQVGQARAPGQAATYGITQDLAPAGAPIGTVAPSVQFNNDGSIGAAPQQPGLFAQAPAGGQQPLPGIADPRGMLGQASRLFALPGGSAIGQGMIEDAFAFAQQNQQSVQAEAFDEAHQKREFTQRLEEQQLEFGQRDVKQDNQNEFTGKQNELNRAADLNEFNREQTETERHNKQLENIKLASEGFVFDENGNPTQSSEALAMAQAQGELGTVPTGYSRHVSEDGLSTYLKAEPGSDDYRNAQDEIGVGEAAIIAIDEQIQSIKETGTNIVGDDSATQNARYGRIISAIAKMRDLGVIQKDEAERLEDSIPNPSDWGTHFTGFDTSTIAAYEELAHQFQSNLKIANQKYSHWGLGSGMAEATPEQIRELNERAAASAAGQAQGIKVDAVPQEAPVASASSNPLWGQSPILTALQVLAQYQKQQQGLFNE